MNNIVVTTANSLYYDSLLTLISSIHKHSFSCVNKIIVYDLGLTNDEKDRLRTLKLVEVLVFPQECNTYFDDYLEPKWHAYKLFCVQNAKNYGNNILWLDAGVMVLQSVQEIFDIIDTEDIFLVGDKHLNRTYTSPECIDIMKATESELNDVHLSSGILGYKVDGKYQSLIDEAFEFSKIPKCVTGDENNHRHDQSVYSILASRYKCKKYDINRYGYWTDLNRNLQTAIENNVVIFVHRRGHYDHSSLQYSRRVPSC